MKFLESANWEISLSGRVAPTSKVRKMLDTTKDVDAPTATSFLRKMRAHLRTRIADGTGVHAYAVDQLLRKMIARAQKLGVRVIEPPAPTVEKLLVLLTMQTAGVLHIGYPKVAL